MPFIVQEKLYSCIFVISYGHAFGIALFVDNVINLIKLSSSTEL